MSRISPTSFVTLTLTPKHLSATQHNASKNPLPFPPKTHIFKLTSTMASNPNPHISSSSSYSSSSPLPLLSDWDQPFTDQELEAIESVVRSATSSSSSSSSSIKRRPITGSEDRQVVRRRLPDSITFTRQQSSNGSRQRRSSSFFLHSCPRYRPQENMKLRYPVMNFGGRIVYSKTATEVEKSADELLKFVEAKKRNTGQVVIGLDIEWRPTFRKGVPPGKAAVMQICGDNNCCYVMHIIHSGIPQNLRCLLEDPTSIKVGVGIANDCTKVFKDHDVSIKDLQDLSSLANQKLGEDMRQWGLESLTERLIHKQLLKPNKIRLGNWEVDVLSKAQLQYAATDAFVSWYLHEVLKTFPDAADNKCEDQLSMLPECNLL